MDHLNHIRELLERAEQASHKGPVYVQTYGQYCECYEEGKWMHTAESPLSASLRGYKPLSAVEGN